MTMLSQTYVTYLSQENIIQLFTDTRVSGFRNYYFYTCSLIHLPICNVVGGKFWRFFRHKETPVVGEQPKHLVVNK